MLGMKPQKKLNNGEENQVSSSEPCKHGLISQTRNALNYRHGLS
jgi:hypothetical protein